MGAYALKYSVWESPVGCITLVASPYGLCRLWIGCRPEEVLKRYSPRPTYTPQDLSGFEAGLEGYFTGRLRELDFPLDLSAATPFQLRVWEVLRRIPYGQVRSYAWVAEAVGSPRAARAVGAANRANPLPIFIPCHRVVLSDGRLGGYSAGVAVKRFLLELEGYSA